MKTADKQFAKRILHSLINTRQLLMALKLNNWGKAFLVFICLILSVVGFMMKLPSAFRHYDKELHAAFYFFAAGFLNVLFTNGKFTRHILIFVVLYVFSVSIEHAQEYSNRFFHTRIHGRYDPEDIKYNLRGLIAYSVLWILYRLVLTAYNRLTLKTTTNNPD
jgi:hypothetical protein